MYRYKCMRRPTLAPMLSAAVEAGAEIVANDMGLYPEEGPSISRDCPEGAEYQEINGADGSNAG